jgi:N-acetylglucosamine kinase-like BadF-type ATPase
MNTQLARPITLGVDGGGTKTSCVALDATKTVLGTGRAGSTNRNSVGDAVARANLQEAITLALQDAACKAPTVAAICLGMAGVDRAGEQAVIAAWVAAVLPGVPASIYNDALVALASGTGGELYGVVVISGTGMIVYGVDRAGQRRRAGGWGPLIGDLGSGYDLGRAALRAIADATDGIGSPTALQTAVLTHLSLSEPQAIIPWIYAEISWARIAALAPLVVTCAQQGDAVANAILDQAAADLAAPVGAVVRGLHLTEQVFPLILAGGNLRPGLLSARLIPRLQQVAPHAQIAHPTVEPAVGAALLAWRALEKEVTSDQLPGISGQLSRLITDH